MNETDETRGTELESLLSGGRRRYLSHVLAAGTLRFAGAFALAIFALSLAGIALARVAEAPYVLAALAAGSLVVAFGLAVVRPLLVAPSLKSYALLSEEKFPEARSWFVNALELAPQPAASQSPDLVRALADEADRRARRLDFATLAPSATPRGAVLLAAAALVAWGFGFAFFGGPLGTSLKRMSDPRAAAATLVRLAVEPGNVVVPPGATLHVRAEVEGTARAPHLVFFGGGRTERVTMDGVGASSTTASGARAYEAAVRGIAAPGSYRVEVAGIESELYTVGLAGQAGIVSYDFAFEYPAYTRLAGETQSATRGDVTALVGTKVTVTVNLDRQAESMTWTGPGGSAVAMTALSPRRFSTTFTVGKSPGTYSLEAKTSKESIRATSPITPIADEPPLLTVIEPEGDLDLPAGQKIPVWAAASDDYGLTDLVLVAGVEGGPVQRVPVARWADRPREASAGSVWDAAGLALLPGQTAQFHLELRDNDNVSGPNVTVSRTFQLRFPLLSELYQSLEEKRAETQATLEDTKRQTQELEKQVDDLQKSLQNDRKLDWEKQQAAKDAAEKQKALADQVSKAADQLEQQAKQAEERRAYEDQLLAKMQELSKLVAGIKNEELKRSLEELSKRMEQTDPRQLQQQLKDLQQQQKEMLASLERSIELMKQLRKEEEMHAAAERAKELAQRQDALNQQFENRTPKDAEQAAKMGDEQKKIEDQAHDLAQDLKQMSDPKPQDGQKSQDGQKEQAKPSQPSEDAAQTLEQEITPQMQQSEQGMRQSSSNTNAKQKASKAGKQAKSGLEQLAQQLTQAAQSMSQDENQAAAEAIRRSAQDLVNLSQAGEESLDRPGSSRERAERQEDLKQGASQVIDDLIQTGKDTPYLSGEAVQELGRAMNELEKSKDAFSQGNDALGKQAGERAGEALDRAVLSLRESEQACQRPGPRQGGKNASSRDKMQGLAGQQGELNQESQSLAERLSQQQRLAAGDQNTLERLAGQQQMIRQGLEEAMQNAKPEDGLLGRMDQTKDDMEQVEQDLSRGRLTDETIARQQKILSRMLDAQRSLNRRDYEEQRESKTGVELTRPSPEALKAALLKHGDRTKNDLLRAQAEKFPSEYRSLVESYLRSLGATE